MSEDLEDLAGRFGRRLRELREQAGLTQAALAGQVGVGKDAVARWEQGTREPLWSSVVALARALGVEVGAFLEEPAATTEAREPGRPPGSPARGVAEPAKTRQKKRKKK
jgi:transcriptional regulator with XRE-family HTH domain